MAFDLRLPDIKGNEREQLKQIRSYLYQLVPQLQFALSQTESTAVGSMAPLQTSSSGTVLRTESNAMSQKIRRLSDRMDSLDLTITDIEYAMSQIGDFVTDMGIKGVWSYRKWFRGIAECRCTVTFSTAFLHAQGSLYLSDLIERMDYPLTFESRPVETVTVRGPLCFVCTASGEDGMNTETQSAKYCALSPTEVNEPMTLHIDYYVLGKRKQEE